MTPPPHPIAAVTHADPYPYYAELVARRPLYRDDALGLWVASSAATVTAVLTSELCRVRPRAEPVPRALLGSPAGEIFGHLVRMNDGPRHDALKIAVSTTLGSLDAAHVASASRRWARGLVDELQPARQAARVTDVALRLPVYVVASALGVEEGRLAQTARWTDDFVRCLAPASSPEQIQEGIAAAGHLLALFAHVLDGTRAARPAPLLGILAREARGDGRDDRDAVVANGVGFLSQTYEATAALISNTLVALASHRDVRADVTGDRSRLTPLVQEVLRYDAPVQNTRRFLTGAGTVAGQAMKEGEAILVVLAAANRDPAANPHPDRLDRSRRDPRLFTFGLGAHACPGAMLATTIAAAAVDELILAGLDLEHVADRVSYRPSANVRLPLFGSP
jgi:cytochrome P450